MSQPTEDPKEKPKRWIYIIPLVLFSVLMIVFFIGLGLNPRLLPSPLIDQPAPGFNLARLKAPDEMISQDVLKGEPSLLNIWATWCVSCRVEHPVLMKIAASKEVPIFGLFYKDERSKGLAWLKDYGDPYVASGMDLDGKIAIDWGLYGAPETFVIDKDGVIRYKHVGPITWDDWQNILLPKIKSLRAGSGV
ncbi:MAG: DsbE family thiol:disulfide interchange protein [Gammaproteobacteria bacterium]|jgi:cytochrome c biogenesis protein CcmG, thiol:disulfide interchange protein DsbE|nr:DsbE family thiol:disulfide interchange protein [Gammaproteobacteria bacterium]